MKARTLEKLGLGLLVTVWLVWGSNMIGNALIPMPKGGHGEAAEAPAGTQGAKTAATPATAPEAADIGTLLAKATPDAGQKVFNQCKACHTGDKGGPNRVGPNLWDVVGRGKASASGFAYSDAIKAKGGTWTYEDLNHFLANPKAFAPGTRMTFIGLKRAEDRAAVIAHLRSFSDSPKPLP